MHSIFNASAIDNTYFLAAIWMGLALIGALIAIRVKISAALIEIVLGILAGNFIALRSNDWIDFVAGFGSIMLTFLAGAEIDPVVLRGQWRPAVVMGLLSFLIPFAAALLYARLFAHWS
ncbi:MAG: cation:proton antiporter, partial [Candidatus Eremiobacteraeota bacterium]|nr:cation:proton antiporter [Candidatus Eremiobacteraeota bacterium]